jgi:type I restriction enzyme S subunit
MKSLANSRPTTKVGTLCDQIRGVSYAKEDARAEASSGLVPILRANNILEDGLLTYDDLVFVPESVVSEMQYIRKFDIVIAASSGSLSVVGKAAQARHDWHGGFGAFCKVLRPNKKVDPRYLAYFFRTAEYRQRISHLAAGVNINNLRNEHLDDLEIPLPPLPEQRRIADILDKADAIRRKRQEARDLLASTKVAVFHRLFGDPIENTRKWERRSLGDVLESIDSGTSPKCLERSISEGEWGILKLGAVTWCEYDWKQNKALPGNVAPDPSIEVKCGDLLFTRKNTYELVAAAAYVFDTPPRLMLPDLVFRLRIKSGFPAMPEYLWGLLTYPTKRKKVQALAGGAAGSMPNISKTKLLQELVELPPLELQQTYAKTLHKTRKLSEKCDAGCKEASNLFNSLVQRAFRGEL